MTSDFPVARICLAQAQGRLAYQKALRLLAEWARDRSEAEAWLAAARQPRAPGYGESRRLELAA